MAWGNTEYPPMIMASGNCPAIITRGENTIQGFIIQGEDVEIELDIDAALTDRETVDFTITDCEIRYSYRGIEANTPTDLNYCRSISKAVSLHIKHNYIHTMAGDGIRSELTGPLWGSLIFNLDIKENVIEQTFTGITLRVIGQNPNPSYSPRATYGGCIDNNLIFNNRDDGISLYGENLGWALVFIGYNTIADNGAHGIIANTETGPDGNGAAFTYIVGNIISGNGGYGFEEFNIYTSPFGFSYNVFFNNALGHYADEETMYVLNSEADLNTPRIDDEVVFWSGTGNRVGDPMFTNGHFYGWELLIMAQHRIIILIRIQEIQL